jgi:hypothetical protein
MQQSTDEFIRLFLNPPPGKSPADIHERLWHWINVANRPELKLPSDTKPEDEKRVLADLRRKALQNVRRTAAKYPEIAKQLIQEREVQ